MNDEHTEIITSKYNELLDAFGGKLILKERGLPTAIVASNIFGKDELNLAIRFGMSTLWLFGIDRWFDERDYSSKEIVSLCNSVIHERVVDDETEELIKWFGVMKNELFNNHQDPFFSLWKACLLDTVYKGMMFEHIHKGKDKKMDLEQYLFFGRESIGLKFVNYSVLSGIDTNILYRNYIDICSLQNCSADIIRLANDLVTADKEIKEKNINSLTVLGGNYQENKVFIIETINSKKEFLIALSQEIEDNRFVKYINDIVKTTLHFYEKSDFYDSESDLKDRYYENKK